MRLKHVVQFFLIVGLGMFLYPSATYAEGCCVYYEGVNREEVCRPYYLRYSTSAKNNLVEVAEHSSTDYPCETVLTTDMIESIPGDDESFSLMPKNIKGSHVQSGSCGLSVDGHVVEQVSESALSCQVASKIMETNGFEDLFWSEVTSNVRSQLEDRQKGLCCVPKVKGGGLCHQPAVIHRGVEDLVSYITDSTFPRLLSTTDAEKRLFNEFHFLTCDTDYTYNESDFTGSNSAAFLADHTASFPASGSYAAFKDKWLWYPIACDSPALVEPPPEYASEATGVGFQLSSWCGARQPVAFCSCKKDKSSCKNGEGYVFLKDCEDFIKGESDMECVEVENGLECSTLILQKDRNKSGLSDEPIDPIAALRGDIKKLNKLGTDDVNIVFANMIRAGLGILGSLAVLMIIYGGALWMTAAGNAERESKGLQTLIWAGLGVVVIFASYAILDLIFDTFSDF